jgi:hypothetical protein
VDDTETPSWLQRSSGRNDKRKKYCSEPHVG